jgi:hypothetical protein
MIGSTFAAGSLPIDLTLIAVDASLGSLQRGVAEVQADPGSLKRLAGVLDPSTRFIDQSASAFLESTTLGCELLVRRVEPVLALARCPFALVSDSLAILSNSVASVGATVATGRGLITPAGPGSIRPESSAVSARSVLALPRLARGNLSGLSHASTLLADLRRSAVRWTRFPAPRQPGAALHDPILDVRREPDRTHGDGAHHFGGATNAAGG